LRRDQICAQITIQYIVQVAKRESTIKHHQNKACNQAPSKTLNPQRRKANPSSRSIPDRQPPPNPLRRLIENLDVILRARIVLRRRKVIDKHLAATVVFEEDCVRVSSSSSAAIGCISVRGPFRSDDRVVLVVPVISKPIQGPALVCVDNVVWSTGGVGCDSC
jgi:hypothetical protein